MHKVYFPKLLTGVIDCWALSKATSSIFTDTHILTFLSCVTTRYVQMAPCQTSGDKCTWVNLSLKYNHKSWNFINIMVMNVYEKNKKWIIWREGFKHNPLLHRGQKDFNSKIRKITKRTEEDEVGKKLERGLGYFTII